MATILPVKRGLSSPAVTGIPDKWDKEWFRYFITNFLVNADIRNVATGPGISVSGNISGDTTTGSGSTVTISQSPIGNNTVLGNVSGASAIPSALSKIQVTSLINLFSPLASGAVPASGGGIVNFLRADGTFALPAYPISANPTALSGPFVVNGTALTFMTSDSAPAVNTAISYTWGGIHTFTARISAAFGITVGGGTFVSRGITDSATATALAIASTGAVTISTPTSGDTLTVGPSVTSGALIATNAALTTGAGAAAGTLTNAPSAGNPTKWIKINDNGTIRSVPAW